MPRVIADNIWKLKEKSENNREMCEKIRKLKETNKRRIDNIKTLADQHELKLQETRDDFSKMRRSLNRLEENVNENFIVSCELSERIAQLRDRFANNGDHIGNLHRGGRFTE
jgi:gas vesicle protein